jgi:hypothetical protein
VKTKCGFASLVLFVLSLAAVAFAGGMGCSTSHVVPASGDRPPTNAKDVKLYTNEPKKYEKLGTVEVPVGGDVRWDSNGDATPGFEKLKAAAAAKGANGILLLPGKSQVESVVAGYKGKFYQVPLRRGTPSAVVVEAVFVIEP